MGILGIVDLVLKLLGDTALAMPSEAGSLWLRDGADASSWTAAERPLPALVLLRGSD